MTGEWDEFLAVIEAELEQPFAGESFTVVVPSGLAPASAEYEARIRNVLSALEKRKQRYTEMLQDTSEQLNALSKVPAGPPSTPVYVDVSG